MQKVIENLAKFPRLHLGFMNEEIKNFDAFYLKGVKNYGIVGSSFAFVHDDQVITKHAYGMAHIANNYKVDEDTILR